MVCFSGYKTSAKENGGERKTTPPRKCPIQVSEELHALIVMMSENSNKSLEQIVSGAVIKGAKTAVPTISDGEYQKRFVGLIRRAEEEIRYRYHRERSRRSTHMRRLNNEKRHTTQQSADSPAPTFRHYTDSYRDCPVEYRYGFAIPKPPPSSYPTYYHD